jgi:uncharacterized protein
MERDTGRAMSQENVEFVRGGYVLLNQMLASGEVDISTVEKSFTPDCVLKPAGVFPESAEMRGHEGMARYMTTQMEAFEELQVEPLEFVDAGDRVMVPIQLGGKARHTGIEIDFAVVHVWTVRDGKIARLEMFRGRAEALEAAGLSE